MRGFLRRLAARMHESRHIRPSGRVVASARSPAGWHLIVRQREGRFDSSLIHPGGSEVACSYWQPDIAAAAEFLLGYLSVRDPFQSGVIRRLMLEAMQ